MNTRPGSGLTRSQALLIVLGGLTLVAVTVCFLIIYPFISVLAWALALAIVARPLHVAIASRIASTNVAAGIAVAAVAVLIGLPLTWVGHHLIGEASAGVGQAQEQIQAGKWLEEVEAMPWLGGGLLWLRENFDIGEAVKQAVNWLTPHLSQILAGSIWAVVQLLLVLFTLFFFLRDGVQARRAMRSLLPLSNREADEIFTKVADTIHATIYGSVFVAVIQGTLGGLIFGLLDLPSPVLWGFVMTVAAVVPNLGAFVIWLPVAALLALGGDWMRAAVLAAWGAVAIGLIDNLLYPYLVGQRMKLHTLTVFYALVGGVLLLGAAGIVLGPVILVLTLALVDVWRKRTAQRHDVSLASPPGFKSNGRPRLEADAYYGA